ncbi:MAG: DUF2911 domain-containing protein [Mucilaginibacter sp.]
MKKLFQLTALAAFVIALFTVTTTFAQDAPKIKKAVDEVAQGKIGNANVTINYGSPSLQGREILGKIEPYGKPWRAGANAATKVTTTAELNIDGHKLPAGVYSLYMVPGEKDWKVIFNSAIPSWGIAKDPKGPGMTAANDPTKDLFSINVKAKAAGPTEKLRYEVRPNGIALVWENVEVFIPAK